MVTMDPALEQRRSRIAERVAAPRRVTFSLPRLSMLRGLANRPHDLECLGDTHVSLLDVLVQMHPLDQIHRVVVDALVDAAVVDAGDVRMSQPRC